MSARVLVDTNVLVYAYDRSAPDKQRRALDVLDNLVVSDVGAISTQVLAELFVAVTRKIANPRIGISSPSEAFTCGERDRIACGGRDRTASAARAFARSGPESRRGSMVQMTAHY